jgi:hypothetical protein
VVEIIPITEQPLPEMEVVAEAGVLNKVGFVPVVGAEVITALAELLLAQEWPGTTVLAEGLVVGLVGMISLVD